MDKVEVEKKKINDEIEGVSSQKINISETLEKDIKFLINYILFQKELQNHINRSKTFVSYKKIPNCYLINSCLSNKYKHFFFYQTLNNIINEELEPVNNDNKSKADDINLINKIYSSLIKLLTQNPDNYNEQLANVEKLNSITNEKYEITYNFHNYNNNQVNYPIGFEIVDEFVYNELKNRYNDFSENNYLKCEIIINEGKIIIKYNNNKYNEKSYFQLLIVSLDNNYSMIFILYLINFTEENNRKEFFELFIESNSDTIMKNYESYFIKDSSCLIFNFIEFNDIIMNFDEKHIGDKIIKIFLYLYFFNDEINQIKQKEIKSNGKHFYYLINKEWMKIYREYYDYINLCNYFEKSKESKSFIYKQLIENIKDKNDEKINEFIYQLTKDIPRNILPKLEELKNKQNELIIKLNNIQSSIEKKEYIINGGNNLKYFGENEIINVELFELINQLETNDIKESIKAHNEKIECLLGENKIYIKSETSMSNSENVNYLLNVGYIKNNIFEPSLIIYLYEKNDLIKTINYYNNNSFSEFVQDYNLIDNSYCDIHNSEMKNIGKICKIDSLSYEIENIIGNENTIINQQSMELLKIIIYSKKFIKEKNSPIQKNKKKFGYIVTKDFINEFKKIKAYKIMDEYISKNNNILELINNHNDKSLEELSKLVQKKFTTKINKEINKENAYINISSTSYNVTYQSISINSNKYINYANNFVFLNEEIYYLYRAILVWRENYSSEYIIGDNKIFIVDEKNKYILVYNIINNIELDLELILNFDNYESSFLEHISNSGFRNFFDYLIFSNDISPLFNSNGKKIGTVYKYISQKNNYINEDINDNVCLDLRKILILYMNYQKLQTQNENSFKEYYLVSKNWIQNYKNYYDFDSVYKELEKNVEIKNLIANLNDFAENNFISDRNVALILNSLPKPLLNKLIEKEKLFSRDYKNDKEKILQISPQEYIDNTQNIFFYYNNFEIIDSKIYKYLFEKLDTVIYTETKYFFMKTGGMKNEAEKALCLFDKKRIVIKLNNNNINSDGKYALYIGHINSSLTFEVDCFLLYDNINLMNEHIEILKNQIGFDNFCVQFMNDKNKMQELKISDKKYGLAVKRS